MPLSLWNHFLPWVIILLQLVNKPFFSSKSPPTLGLNREFMIINLPPYQSIVFSLIFKKLNCDLLSLLFPFCLTPCVHWYAPDLSFSVFLFHWSHFRHKMSPSFSPIQFPPCLPPSFPLVHIVVFVGDFSSWWIWRNEIYYTKYEITFESKQSWAFYVSIVQLHLPGEDCRRRLRQCELSFGGNNSYSLTITFIW